MREVVVGIKGKQPTALRFAAKVAMEREVNLRIVHCLDHRTAGDFVSVPYATFPPETWRAAGETLVDHARTFVEEMAPHLPVESHLASGRPFQTLRDLSKNASMLVVGVDAEAWFGPLFGGSVTQRLVSGPDVPVAVVPERSWTEDIAGPIFVAIDTRSAAEAPLRVAFAEASRTGRELHVAHVVPSMDMFHHSQSHKLAVSEVLAGWSEQFPEVTVKHRFFFDEAAEGCVRASEEASLLVVGQRHAQIGGHPVLAELAKRVHCPCIVVPDSWKGR